VIRSRDPRLWARLSLLAILLWSGLLAVRRTTPGPEDAFVGDGFYYYGALRSLVFDGDLDLTNEMGSPEFLELNVKSQLRLSPEQIEHFRGMMQAYGWSAERFEFEKDQILAKARSITLEEHRAVIARDHPRGPRNDFPPGMTVLAAPFYLLAHVLVGPGDGTQVMRGYERPYRLAVHLGSAVWTTLGCLLLYRLLRRHADEPAALATLWAIFLGSNLSWFVGGIHSHWASALAATAFVLAWCRLHEAPVLLQHWAWLGFAAGFMCLCRWQNAVLGLLPLWTCVTWLRTRAAAPGRLLAGCAVAAASALLAFAPQLAWWLAYEGRWLGGAHPGFFAAARRQLGADPLSLLAPVGGVLWGVNGIVRTHPLLVLSLAGLPLLAARQRPLGPLLLAAFLITWGVNAMSPDWWGGHEQSPIGHRRFDNCIPAFALGLQAWLVPLARRPGWPGWLLFLPALLAAGEQAWLLSR
jgi:hypothetical protein